MRELSSTLRIFGLGAALLCLVRPGSRCPAQTAPVAARSTLTGTVVDPTGAVLPHAALRLTGVGGHGEQFTAGDGSFRIEVPPGTYMLQVEATGFAPLVLHNLHLRSGAELRLPLHLVIATRTEQVDVGGGDLFNPGASSDALVLSGRDLDLLSTDPQAFRQELNALAGPALGGVGPQILVNGFSGNHLPPKSSIREIRIGQDPYSPFYDSVGFTRIEIDTKPSTDKLHGELDLGGTDQPWDARNPYDQGPQPSFFQFDTDASLTGPLNSKTSWYLSEDTDQLGNNAVINATVLDPTLAATPLSEAIAAPQHTYTFAGRLDRQCSKTNFAFLRNEWSDTHTENSGLGGLNPQRLPAAGFTADILTDTLQAADTQLLGPRAVNELRLQYLRTRTSQLPNSTAPAVEVEGAFQDGGSLTQTLHDNADRYELQDRFQFDRGPHAVQFGLRLRELRDSSTSSANFNGLYTFGSLASYQATLAGLAGGLTPAQIRTAGGGAAQFNLTAGNPTALLWQNDLALSGEDDWRLRRGLTLSYGLRFESASATPDHLDPAPRLALNWSPTRGKHPRPLFTLRTGYGIFYDRFPAAALLQSIRQNGVTESAFFLQNPDTFPNLPPAGVLTASEPTLFRVSPTLRTSYNQVGSFGLDRSLGRHGRLSAIGLYTHSTHQYLTRNVNAPLPSTGVRPLGTAGNLYQYSADGNENDELLSLSARIRLTPKLYTIANYTVQQQRGETDGINSFPANPYDLRADYGRVSNIYKQVLNAVAYWTLPHGFVTGIILNAHSGAPYNITTGLDTNGDTVFNDRPSFATDLARPSVIRTALGNFDITPTAGQALVPRNSATGPGLFWMDLQFEKDIPLGPRPHATAMAASAAAQPSAAKALPDRPWSLRLRAEALNLTNRNNPGVPIGVLGPLPCTTAARAACPLSPSPDFGHALSLASDFSPLTASNRTVMLHMYFTF